MTKLRYMDMKRELAKLLGIEQEDVRCNDFSKLWCIKAGKDRELCVIADNAEDAAEALKRRM